MTDTSNWSCSRSVCTGSHPNWAAEHNRGEQHACRSVLRPWWRPLSNGGLLGTTRQAGASAKRLRWAAVSVNQLHGDREGHGLLATLVLSPTTSCQPSRAPPPPHNPLCELPSRRPPPSNTPDLWPSRASSPRCRCSRPLTSGIGSLRRSSRTASTGVLAAGAGLVGLADGVWESRAAEHLLR
jgi:hypothetical protein